VLAGRLRYVHNLYGKQLDVVTADALIGTGSHSLGFVYERTTDDGGTATLLVDGEVVGRGEIPKFTPTSFNNTNAGLSCGYELGPPVGEGYDAPFRFTGSIAEAVVEVTGAPRPDPLAEFEKIMAEQ
jgi:arylsulfatase